MRKIVKAFTGMIKEKGFGVDTSSDIWDKPELNVYIVSGHVVIYVKESSKNPGWWSLNKSYCECLVEIVRESSTIGGGYIVLLSSVDDGYVLSLEDFGKLIDAHLIPIRNPADPHYMIYEDKVLTGYRKLNSFQDIVNKLGLLTPK